MAIISQLEDGKVEISTNRLLLRGAKLTVADVIGLYQAFSDPEVMKYMGSDLHADFSRTEKWLRMMASSPANGATDFIITLNSSIPHLSIPIGKIGVWRNQEIGFFLARQHWGKGIAQEALSALLPYLFDEAGMTEITADIDPRNLACIVLLKKAGFVENGFKERTYQVGENWCDSLYMILTRETWQERD